MTIVWQSLFSKYPFGVVQKALSEYIMDNDTPFAPSPGQLNAIIARAAAKIAGVEDIDRFSAWDMVVRVMASSDCHYEPQKAFDSLPEPVRRSVGSARNLTNWGRMNERELEFVRKNFMERYKEQAEADEDRGRLPETIVRRLTMAAPETAPRELDTRRQGL